MGKRFFWFAIGVSIAVAVVWKGRELYEKLTPRGVAAQLDKARASLAAKAGDFVSTLNEARAEREAELREAIGIGGGPDEDR